jgi:hypothetical protein
MKDQIKNTFFININNLIKYCLLSLNLFCIMPAMSTHFYSVHPTPVQSAMGGTHLHTPQSIFQHTMSHQSINQQNETQWLRIPQVPPMTMPWSTSSFQQPDLVRFTGERAPQQFEPLIHQKRKLETPDVVNT